MAKRRLRWTVILFAAAFSLSGCKVVQIAEQQAAAPAGFNGETFAQELWDPRALPYFGETAKPVGEVVPVITADLEVAGTRFGYRAGEGSPWSFVVSGSGKVVAKNTESRAGILEVAVEGMAEPVTIQIGPVIRGNAIRDALPFVSFKDFTNQLEYANAGKALTALAFEGIAEVASAISVGEMVTFTGAISVSRAGDDVLITPVSLEVAP
ncbi:DUF2291 family protein [Devosia sp. RR2S18]|uniref:DUF2291 family protein n=1 Tax=Devosia rhizosphaerae TaxID=3049774 RepID=UPI00254210F4|nr:DUF2291 domain-containing protein [Devosia sp. RR2S18]WIJ26379.1 DUF2291 domain-containing protein [Devosia sp. RR2S18]